jgi:methylated-DNA-protein-cysteine methyltransferase-like protein
VTRRTTTEVGKGHGRASAREPVPSFDREVYALVRRIPPGRTVTYGQVAAMLGRPRAARAVGGAMRRCPAGVPWHRVLNAQGRISRRKRAASMLTQRMLLEREGVTLRRGRVDIARYAWDPASRVRGHDPRRRRAARAGRGRLRIDDERAWREETP